MEDLLARQDLSCFDILALSFSCGMKYGPNLQRIKKKLSKRYFNFICAILSFNNKTLNILSVLFETCHTKKTYIKIKKRKPKNKPKPPALTPSDKGEAEYDFNPEKQNVLENRR